MRILITLVVGALVAGLPTARASKPDEVGATARPKLSLNPDISVVVDTLYYRSHGPASLPHLLDGLPGFGHRHGHDADTHTHAEGWREGFNLRHVELMLAADVDPYFRGWTIIAVGEDHAELEEAVFQTTRLPWGLKLKGGKFYSDFSRINAQHPHEWSFADRPLVHELLFGDHGLNEKGVQLSWLAPTPFYLELGAEALQGENEQAFAYVGEDPFPRRSGPRVFLGWVKWAPELSAPHAAQVGLFAARGRHQEGAMNAEESEPSMGLDALDGHQWLAGTDFVYRYTPATAHGFGWLTLEGGYLYRRKDLDPVGDLHDRHNGQDDEDEADHHTHGSLSKQDGLYLQGTYGLAPRWRFGLRGELIGLTNSVEAGHEKRDFGNSRRVSAMVDWTLTEFSRIRFQVNRARFETADGRQNLTEGFIQLIISLGAHGAHRF